jgi:hypothetical protein
MKEHNYHRADLSATHMCTAAQDHTMFQMRVFTVKVCQQKLSLNSDFSHRLLLAEAASCRRPLPSPHKHPKGLRPQHPHTQRCFHTNKPLIDRSHCQAYECYVLALARCLRCMVPVPKICFITPNFCVLQPRVMGPKNLFAISSRRCTVLHDYLVICATEEIISSPSA